MTLQTTNNVTAFPEQPDTQPAQPTLWTTVQPWHEPVGSGIFGEIEQVLKTHGHFNNPDDGISEVIYTEFLVVEAGATLRTNGYIIYTSNFENSGLVDNLDDIIIINPPTPGDINGDGLVNIADLLILIGDWGACPNGCGGDIDGDGFANIADLLIVIANWT